MEKIYRYILDVAFMLSAIVLAISCRKDKSVDNPPVSNNKKLVRVQEGPDYSTFSYNADGTLNKVTAVLDFGNGPQTFITNFTYTGKKLNEVSNEGGKVKYFYDGDVLTKTESQDETGEF